MDGPRARISTVFVPSMMKPPISMLAPVSTSPRVEMLVRRASTVAVVVTARNWGLLNPVAAPLRVRSGAVLPSALRL
jgi:hypothetical protein